MTSSRSTSTSVGLGHFAQEWPGLPPLDIEDEAVRAAIVTTFVSAQCGDESRARHAATSLRRAACRFLMSRTRHVNDRSLRQGGLRPVARFRVERLIEQRLGSGELAQPVDVPPQRGCLADVEVLADAAGLSVSHFIRAFRQMTGTTPHQHVMARRLQRALALLVDPGLSIAEVADRLGFSSPAHFVSSFRRKFQVTPGEYQSAVLG